jgi:hypothetical protein
MHLSIWGFCDAKMTWRAPQPLCPELCPANTGQVPNRQTPPTQVILKHLSPGLLSMGSRVGQQFWLCFQLPRSPRLLCGRHHWDTLSGSDPSFVLL